jgi:hypothetical protein
MADQANQAVETTPEQDLLNALGDTPEQEEAEEGAEGEQEQQEEGAQPEEEGEKPAVDQKFRVKVKNDQGEDEERDLTLEELAAGYMQSADYTRKTQAVAAEIKQREEQYFQAVQQTTQQAQQQLAALQNFVLAAAAPDLQNVNWQQLAMEDPARYVQLQARQQQLSQVLGHIQAENQKLEQQREATAQQQREQAIRHSLDYLSREIPGFNLEKERQGLFDTGRKYGFNDAELAGVIDGRMLHVLRDAMQWRQLQTQKPKALQKVAEAPKVIKPAAPQPRKQNQSAAERLKKTGRAEELVNFL